MKWYRRDCDAALIGMRELTDEEYRAYGVFIDLFYSRNGDVDDAAMLCHLNWNRQRWGRIFKQLENKGKMWKLGEKLVGNRVENELLFYQLSRQKSSKNNSTTAVRARVRTKNIEKNIGESLCVEGVLGGNTHTTTLPENWHPELAGDKDFDRFCDHARAKGRTCADWEAAWRNWKRDTPRFNGGHNERQSPQDDPRSIRAAFDRLFDKFGPDAEDEARELSRQVNLRLISGGSSE